MKIKKFRRIQTLFSVALFLCVFALCWYTTRFSIVDIQLSSWGVSEFGWIWNSCLIFLAVSIYINVFYFIKHHTRLNSLYKRFLNIFFLLISIFLFVTGILDLNWNLHYITAYLYFFAYPLVVFLLAHLNRKSLQYREWQIHTLFSVCMIVLPLMSIKFFPGMAIPETIHSIIVIGWNLWILRD